MSRFTRIALLLGLALFGLLGSVGTTTAQEAIGVRAVGGDVFSVGSPVMSSFVVSCVTASNDMPDCALAATGSLKVSAATAKRYGLTSATIAKGSGVEPCGEAQCLKMRSSKAVRARLKGVTRLPVTIVFSASSPTQESMKKQVSLRTKISKRVIFQTSNVGGEGTVPGGRG